MRSRLPMIVAALGGDRFDRSIARAVSRPFSYGRGIASSVGTRAHAGISKRTPWYDPNTEESRLLVA